MWEDEECERWAMQYNVTKCILDLTRLLWRGELSALPSSLTGAVTVCEWDHVGPS